MARSDAQKKGNLSLSDGGKAKEPRRARFRTAAEIKLDKEVAEEFAAMKDAWDKAPNKNFANIAEAYVFPMRVMAKRLTEGKASGVPREFFKRIGWRWIRHVDRVYDGITGEFDIAS